jgi:hypothetical protein
MGNPIRISCAECLESMARAKGELLTRIACANCQQAQEDLAGSERLRRELRRRADVDAVQRERIRGRTDINPVVQILGRFRCAECGKWCWGRNALAAHRELHGSLRN